MIDLHVGDALDVFRRVRGLASIVSDPPGGGSFMDLPFDVSHGGRDRWIPFWAERFKVGREATDRGSYGLFWAFGRTAHWTACALDDAGWEVVRPILHIHGQGWPKGKSQLKPAQEIWWLCRWGPVTPLQVDRCRVRRSWAERSEAWFRSGHSAKPEASKIAAPPGNGINVHEGGSWPPDLLLTHAPACACVGVREVNGAAGGTHARAAFGLMNDDAFQPRERRMPRYEGAVVDVPAWECLAVCECGLASLASAGGAPPPCACGAERRWACPVAMLDEQSAAAGMHSAGSATDGSHIQKRAQIGYHGGTQGPCSRVGDVGNGSAASRFFPCFHYDAKAARAERQAGCDGLLWVRDKAAPIGWRRVDRAEYDAAPEKDRATGNVHSTIKPIGCGADDGLMRWLVRLITPEGGRVGDITMGSGGTGVACQIEGHDFVGCDIDPGAVDIARARLAFWTPEMHRHVLREAEALRAAVRREKPVVDDFGPLFAAAGGAR